MTPSFLFEKGKPYSWLLCSRIDGVNGDFGVSRVKGCLANEGFFVLVPGGDATALAQVAKPAGQGEIAENGVPALLFTDDVIDVVTSESDGFGHAAVFATIVCCFLDLPAKNYGDVSFAHAFIKRR